MINYLMHANKVDLLSFRKSDSSWFTPSKVTSVRVSRFSRSWTKWKIHKYYHHTKKSKEILLNTFILKWPYKYLPFSLMSRRLSIAIALLSIFPCNSLTFPIMSVILSSTEKVWSYAIENVINQSFAFICQFFINVIYSPTAIITPSMVSNFCVWIDDWCDISSNSFSILTTLFVKSPDKLKIIDEWEKITSNHINRSYTTILKICWCDLIIKKKSSSLPIPGNEVEFGRLDDLVVVGNTVGLIVVISVVSSSFSSSSSSFSHLPHVCKHFLTTSSQPALFRSSRHSRKINYVYLLKIGLSLNYNSRTMFFIMKAK